MTIFGHSLADIAANAGYILTISTLVGLIFKQLILKPFEKKRLREQERQNEFTKEIFLQLESVLEPITANVDSLNALLSESQKDRDTLHEKTDMNTNRIGEMNKVLDNHEIRISVIESHTGIRKMNYKELYGKDKPNEIE